MPTVSAEECAHDPSACPTSSSRPVPGGHHGRAPVAPAAAQYRPLPAGSFAAANDPVGEPYHIESVVNWWTPSPDIVIASEIAGHPGDGYCPPGQPRDREAVDLRDVPRAAPGRKHKFRFNYIPQKYEADTILSGEIISTASVSR